jgi:hypothetical protein
MGAKAGDSVRTRRRLVNSVLVALSAVAATAAGLGNQFAHDDVALVRDNARLHGERFAELFTLSYWPPPFPPELYRPVTSLLLTTEYMLGGGAPLAFRIVSSLLYAAVCVGLFQLAREMVRGEIAFGIAFVFAVHPVHVEAVAQAVSQSELLVGLMTVLAVLLYVRRRRTGSLGWADWTLLGLIYGCAALAKEQGFLLPAFLVAAEVFLVADSSWRARGRTLWRGYALLVALGAAVVLVRAAVLHGNVVGSFTAEALVGLDVRGRALTMLGVVPEWVRLLVWPSHLRADYSPAEFVASSHFGPREALGLGVLVAWAVAVWATRRRAPTVAFGLVWCALALLPVSNLLVPTGILLAERTLFLPSIGVMLALGAGADWLRGPAASRALVLACAALVVAGAVRSLSRYRVWHDDHVLSIASVHDAPRSWRAQRAYGETLFDLGAPAQAIAAYRAAIAVAPEPWFLRNSLSQRLREMGDEAGALQELERSLAARPGQKQATAELVAVLLGVGQYDEARRVADSVIAVDGAPLMMVRLRRLADSAQRVNAPIGSIRIRVR